MEGKTMALNIANKNVEKKAILASRILGVNKTAAVEKALDYYLEYCGRQELKKVRAVKSADCLMSWPHCRSWMIEARMKSLPMTRMVCREDRG